VHVGAGNRPIPGAPDLATPASPAQPLTAHFGLNLRTASIGEVNSRGARFSRRWRSRSSSFCASRCWEALNLLLRPGVPLTPCLWTPSHRVQSASSLLPRTLWQVLAAFTDRRRPAKQNVPFTGDGGPAATNKQSSCAFSLKFHGLDPIGSKVVLEESTGKRGPVTEAVINDRPTRCR
jgi:hypothetical protein